MIDRSVEAAVGILWGNCYVGRYERRLFGLHGVGTWRAGISQVRMGWRAVRSGSSVRSKVRNSMREFGKSGGMVQR